MNIEQIVSMLSEQSEVKSNEACENSDITYR